MDIRFEQAVFLQQNKDNIDCIVNEFKYICPKVMSNTLVQMTNPDLIQRIIDASEFVYNNDITPTSLKMIVDVIEESDEYVKRSDFIRCSNAIKDFSSILKKFYDKNK